MNYLILSLTAVGLGFMLSHLIDNTAMALVVGLVLVVLWCIATPMGRVFASSNMYNMAVAAIRYSKFPRFVILADGATRFLSSTRGMSGMLIKDVVEDHPDIREEILKGMEKQ